MDDRHYDDGTSIHSFTNLFLVCCPDCSGYAEVRRKDSKQTPHSWKARFCCTACATVKYGRLFSWTDRDPIDWIFKYPLWLQTQCCGKILWAYNLKHLNFLESYVWAKHRVGLQSADVERMQIRNSTLASSLPTWLISAKNRESVLKSIAKLHAKVAK